MIEVTSDLSEVCVFLNEDGIMLDNYEIIIFDVTGEKKFYETIDITNKTNCTHIDNALVQTQCAPFIVSVRTVNDFGHMSKNITWSPNSIQGFSDDQICSCLRNNGKIVVTILNIE